MLRESGRVPLGEMDEGEIVHGHDPGTGEFLWEAEGRAVEDVRPEPTEDLGERCLVAPPRDTRRLGTGERDVPKAPKDFPELAFIPYKPQDLEPPPASTG